MLKRSIIHISLLLLFALSATALLAQDVAATETVAETAAEAVPAASGGMVIGVLHLHSAVRWLVVLITVVLLVKLVIGLVSNGAFDSLTRSLVKAFAMGISLQWVVGILLFVVMGGFNVMYRIEHAVIMTVAVALAHMTNRWKNAPDAQRYRMTLIIVLVVLALVYIGVARLPQGWRVLPTV